ncbi:hypothetical protein FRC00_001391 [Tulasnella sp. 408]|nr:hypothetical protein FRC00_001391 [Tulasnella sp. 408]
MTTTCHSLIEDAIQDLLQGHINSTTDDGDQEGPVSEYQRLKVKSDALESQIKVLRDAKRVTDMACDLEPLSRSPNAIESPREKDLRLRRRKEERILMYWKDDSCEPAGKPAPRILEWTEKTIESVIATVTQEQADEPCKDTDLEHNLPWNSPLVSGPLIVKDQLQQRLSPMEKQLANLRWQQNALIPIARVPPEILIDVFDFVLDAADYLVRDDTHLLLTVLTRICRDWHALIFNTPRLWSCISPRRSTSKHVDAALARSKPFPLSLHYYAAFTSHIDLHYFFSAIKRHAERLKGLDLRLALPPSVDALNSLFAKVFPPRLEILRIELRFSGSAAAWPEISFIQGSLHDTLQHLYLHGVRLPPGGYGELRGLRSLMLTPGADRMMLNTAEILWALSNSPNIEMLRIHSITELEGELSAETTYPVTPVRLDHLRDITLRLPPASLHAFLRSIQATALIIVDIRTTMSQEDESAWAEVLLTDEIQPFVQVIETILQSIPAISFSVISPKLNLLAHSKNGNSHTYNAPYVNLEFAGGRLAEVGRWMAKSLDLGSAEVALHIEDKSTLWMDAVPFILSKFHNTLTLKLRVAESISQQAIHFLSTSLYTDSAGSQHFPVPRLIGINALVHEPSSVISMLERRYIQHGSTDVTSSRHPVALSSLILRTDMGQSALHSTLVKRSASGLPGCDILVELISEYIVDDQVNLNVLGDANYIQLP